jgi:hypothetical protein
MAGIDRVGALGLVRPIRRQIPEERIRCRAEEMKPALVDRRFLPGGSGDSPPAKPGEPEEEDFARDHFSASTMVVRLCLIIPS